MLSQGQHVIAFAPAGGIHNAALHAGAEGTEGIVLHLGFGLLSNWLAFVKIGYAQLGQIGLQARGIEIFHLRVDGNRPQIKMNGRMTLKMQQAMQQ